MRIAILSPFYPYRGGIAQFSGSMMRALQQTHEVKAFTFTRQYPDFLFPGTSQYVNEDDNVEAIESERILDSIGPLSWERTARAINAYQPEVVIIRFWMPFFGPSLGWVARRVKARVVGIVDNAIPHERRAFDRLLTRFFLRGCDHLVTLSEAVERDIYSLIGKDRGVTVIPHPVYDHFGSKLPKSTAREQLGIHPLRKTILFFGLIREYKGLDILIRAFNELDDTYQLVIAGECYGDDSAYRMLIDQNCHRENIVYINKYIDDKLVPWFFSAADLCVLPYRTATQSGITAIALHFELPIVSTDTGGLREMVADAGMGLVTRGFEPMDLAEAIEEATGEDRLEGFRASIKEHKMRYSWGAFVGRLGETFGG